MKKNFLGITACFLMLSLAIGESSALAEMKIDQTPKTKVVTTDEERTEKYNDICVDIGINEDGYYALMGDIEINYSKDAVDYIYVEDPAVLTFNVSSEYKGGVWVMDLDEGQKAIDELTEIVEILKASGNSELTSRIETVIETISNSGPFTQAIT